jgi:hypothetical protein
LALIGQKSAFCGFRKIALRHFDEKSAKPCLRPGIKVQYIRGRVLGLGSANQDSSKTGANVIILGIILLVVGYFTGLAILEAIGGILVVIGVILWILGAAGRPVAGRKVWS